MIVSLKQFEVKFAQPPPKYDIISYKKYVKNDGDMFSLDYTAILCVA